MVLSIMAEVMVALARITKFLVADELVEPYLIDASTKNAISVDGDFVWETAGKIDESKNKPEEELDQFRKALKKKEEDARKKKEAKEKREREKKEKEEKRRQKKNGALLPTVAEKDDQNAQPGNEESTEKPFELNDLNIQVPRGSFVGIIGPVASGKVGGP